VAAVVVLGALVAALAMPDRLHVAGFTDPGAESSKVRDELHHRLGFDPRPGLVVLARSRVRFDTPPGRAALTRLAARLRRDPAVGAVQSAVGVRSTPALLSRDRYAALVLVNFRRSDENTVEGPLDRLRDEVRQPGLDLAFGGFSAGFIDTSRDARSDLVRGELIAFPLLALLLLWVFRGVAAAAIPLAVGGVAVAATFAALRLLAHAVEMSVFALNLAVFLGLGLAVDYGLLLVSRFREHVAGDQSVDAAVSATLATAGRTIVLSAIAVSAGSCALLVFPESFIYSMGIAGVIVPLVSAGAALAIAPLLLRRAGGRIAAAAPAEAADGGRWGGWARWVMRRHLAVAQVSIALVIAAAAQALTMTPTFGDKDAIPSSFESRRVNDAIDREFVPRLIYPIDVVLHTKRGGAAVAGAAFQLRRTLLAAPGVRRVGAIVGLARNALLVQAVPRSPPFSEASQTLVRQLRALPQDVRVGGTTAEFVDLKRSVADRAWLAIAIAAVATLAVLLALTRSLVLPVKTVLFNAISLGAVVGLMVLVFENGALGIRDLLGYDGPSSLDITSTVVVVAIALGLATDYSILLLARIAEEHRAGRTDEDAVARGMERTGPVITRAALLLAVALLALVTSGIFLVKQLTFGLALGVLLDATLVRMLLVPASMRLLGRANWWMPGRRGKSEA
jgi:putative drug exporter of the RND superfamily